MDTTEISEITAPILIAWSAFIGFAAFIAYLVYRSIERPRLVLTQAPDGLRATKRDVALYAATIPVLLFLWWGFFAGVLLVNANEINPTQFVIFPIALVIAIRTLAFVAPHGAHELAKVIPVALIAFVILDGNIRSEDEMAEMLDSVAGISLTVPALLLFLAYDYILTAVWYWGWIRWGQPQWSRFRSQRSRLTPSES